MAEEQKNTDPPKQDATAPEDDSLDTPAAASSEASTDGSAGGVGEPKQAPASPGGGFRNAINIYYIFFVIIVLLAVGAIIYAVKFSNKGATPQKASTLTSQQLAALKGNTTVVGDSKQSLDIQSNTVFEGQVLVRSDFSVAGALKVGGPLSLPTITVSGNGTFGQLQVNDTLGVAGNTTVQGALTVQKDLSVSGAANFGSLSVSSLSVTTLQLTGDLNVVRHIVTSGTSVVRSSSGTALGAGGTVSVSGTDTAGTVTINTGSNPPAGLFISVNFAQAFATTPRVIISPVGFAAGSVTYYVTRSTTGFSIGCATPPPAGSSFSFDYMVID